MGNRRVVVIRFLGLGVVLGFVITGVSAGGGFAQDAKPKAGKQHLLTEQELEQIQRRLDQIAENHETLRQALEEIKSELAIVKLRVTR